MPTDQEHLSKCSITEAAQLALQADSSDHPDWIVITAFYQALHWIDAFFATKQYHPPNHAYRNRAVRRDVDLRQIRNNYRRLYRASRFARYEARAYKNKPAEVRRLLEVDLEAVVTHISGLINPPQT